MASIPASWRVWSWLRMPALPGGRPPMARGWAHRKLARCDAGGWHLGRGHHADVDGAGIRHVWQTAGWLTIAFQVPDSPTIPEVTVWRCGLSESSWRHLCLWVSRDLAMAPPAGTVRTLS